MPVEGVDEQVTAHVAAKRDLLGRLAVRGRQLWPRIRLLAPPTIGALLLTPFVLVDRLKDWMSPDPFFAYIHFFLFFFPSPLAAGAYLERSVITLLFVAVGTSIAFLAICGCIWIDGENAPAYSSEKSRAIGICVLIFFCFSTGTLSSYAPRLKGPCRALLFSTLWELTSQYNVISARIFLNNFYPALVAMVVGIFCNFVVFPRTARGTSIGQLCDLLDGTQRLTARAVQDFFQERTAHAGESAPSPSRASETVVTVAESLTFKKLKGDLESLHNRLELNLDAAKYEVAFARVPIGHLQVFLPTLRSIRGWFSCSLTCLTESKLAEQPTENPEDPARPLDSESAPSSPRPAFDFEAEIRSFSAVISSSLTCMCQCVRKCTASQPSTKPQLLPDACEKGLDIRNAIDDPYLALSQQKLKLRASIRMFKTALSDAIKGTGSEVIANQPLVERAATVRLQSNINFGVGSHPNALGQSSLPDSTKALAHLFRTDAYQISFLMISLLEVALLVDSLLNAALSMAKVWRGSPGRSLHIPAANWRYWFIRTGITAEDATALADERVDALLHEDEPPSPSSEEFAGVDYFDTESEDYLRPSTPPKLERTASRASNSIATIHAYIKAKMNAFHRLFWTDRALRCRMGLSKAIHVLRHSRNIKFGIKLTAGIVLLTLPAWLALGHAKRWWLYRRGQWMAISYLFCLETSTGASFRTSLFRILGTVGGSLLGLIISEISQGNPYALAFLLMVATLPPSYLMLFTPFLGVGVVMGLTLPIVAIIPTQGARESVVYVAWNRGYMIFFGIVAALIVNLLVWPIHARLELVRRVSLVTSQLQSLYLSLSRQMLSGGLTSSHKSNAAFERLEVSIEKRIGQARGLIDIMSIEVSLKPKRTKVLSELLDHLEIIYELLMGLRRCREHGLRSIRQNAVVNVLEMRQSFIASVSLVLWTTGQALQTKAPLPQCLPSPRLALEELTEAVAEQLQMMMEGVELSHRPQRHRPPGHVPDAFHALNSLNQKSILASVRRRTRKHNVVHSQQSSSPIGGSHSAASSPSRDHLREAAAATTAVSGADTPATSSVKRSLDYAMFFILAEHALLQEIVSSLERLMELCRSMVGEATFLRTEFVPVYRSHSEVDRIGAPHDALPATAPEQDGKEGEQTTAQRVTIDPVAIVASSTMLERGRRPRDVSPMNRPAPLSTHGPSPLAKQQGD